MSEVPLYRVWKNAWAKEPSYSEGFRVSGFGSGVQGVGFGLRVRLLAFGEKGTWAPRP